MNDKKEVIPAETKNNNHEVMPMSYADLMNKLIEENKQLEQENSALKAEIERLKKELTETKQNTTR